jgi:hypothetical protein
MLSMSEKLKLIEMAIELCRIRRYRRVSAAFKALVKLVSYEEDESSKSAS